MNVLQADQPATIGREEFIDMETIRRRVEMIKKNWSPETKRARAAEGARRREELESLFLGKLCDVSGSEEDCDLRQYGLSLVG